jgi:thioredoxin
METDPEIEVIRQQKMREMHSQTMIKVPDHIVNIQTVEEFNKLAEEFKNFLIIIDFWAPWCGPCRAFGPSFDALHKEYFARSEPLVFAKVNIDQLGIVAQELGISGVPTTIFVKGKKIVHHQVGALPKAQFNQVISQVKSKVF